jgi:ketosteroid isomerase-like protein
MTADVDDLRSASDAALTKVQEAVAQEDSETLASVFTENGSITVPSGQTIRGKTTIRSMGALMMMTWGGGDLKVTRDTLGLKETTGHEIGRFVFRRPVKDQKDQIWSGGYTAVWEKEAGVWRISRISGLLSPSKTDSKKPDGK